MGHSQSTPSAHGSISTLQQPSLSNSRQIFTYKPLTHPRSFRILRLTRKLQDRSTSWEDVVLYGSIIEASLDNIPEYFALSYTWGNSSLSDKICIDGRVLGITQNCADALRRMLKGKFKRMIWVDSICINQADDAQALQERGRQVALMDEIYSKATQVNVHLGSGDEKSDVAIKAVKRLVVAYLPAKMAKMSGVGQEVTRRRYDEVADEVLANSAEFPYGKLHGLFCLPWFRRTWVVQEVALARKVTFYCGDHLLAFDSLVVAADFTRLPYSGLHAGARHWNFYLDWHHALAEFIRRREQGENVGFGLLQLLSGTMMLEATRPEDKVYGMYGCAKRLGLDLPFPDYTKSIAQVYTEATLACLQQAGNLELLHMVEGAAAAELGLPSWVPNFSESPRKWTPTNPPKTRMPSRKNKLVSGASRCQWMITQEGRRLKVLGRRLDQVAAVSESWKTDARTTLLGDSDMNSGQVVSSLVDCIATWLDVVLQRNHRDGTNTADELAAMQDLTHLLITGHVFIEAPDRIADYLSVLIKCARANDEALRSHLIHPQDDIVRIPHFGDLHTSQHMGRAIEYMSQLMWKLVFRTTRKAYLGTGSYSSRPGDLVVVLCGMAVPVLIRPCAEGFNFVGAAFVDGIMEGEFWNAGSDADDEWFVLL